MSQLWGVYLGNQLLAGALWIQSHGKTIFLFSAVSDEGKKLMAMSWLIDKYISTHSEKPLILDFEGSNNNGLARFYAGFGALNRPYQRVSHNNLVLPAKLALYLWQKSRIRLKKYLSMLNN
jgi:hypothetical protein